MRRFSADEWPYGLRCMDCGNEFVSGQPIAERLTSVDRFEDGEPVFTVEIVCVGCSLAPWYVSGDAA